MKFFSKLFILLLAPFFLFQCSDDDDSATNPGNGDGNGSGIVTFSRDSMLLEVADAVIIPAFAALQTEVSLLNTSIQEFTATPTEASLTSLQNQWAATYRTWQNANAFNFGPASTSRGTLDRLIGTFPVDTQGLEGFVGAGDTSFDNLENDTRGFLAIEYMIYGDLSESNADVVAAFSVNGDNRKAYLVALGNHIAGLVDTVVDDWGSYRANFLAQNGTDAASSISLYYNNFVLSFEIIKNFKLRLPSGNDDLSSEPDPMLVECLYIGLSVEMIELHFAAVERIWRGETTNGTAIRGFKDWAESLEGGSTLVENTESQLSSLKTALADLPAGTLATLIENGSPEVDTAYLEMQKLTRFWKSDLWSLLGLTLTFDSGDGD